MLSLNVIIICVVSTVTKGKSLQTRRVLLHPWLCVIEANIIDAEALFPSGALLPLEILLCMAADLDWRPCGDEVPRYVLPATTAIHFKAAEEIPAYIWFITNTLDDNICLVGTLSIGENKILMTHGMKYYTPLAHYLYKIKM
jgi:hypothetical protein